MEALPEPYAATAAALYRYFMYNGAAVMDAEGSLTMMGDFVDLWERAVADGTSARAIVGVKTRISNIAPTHSGNRPI